MPLRALRLRLIQTLGILSRTCGERHHALAGIATECPLCRTSSRPDACGERHHALAGIATRSGNLTRLPIAMGEGWRKTSCPCGHCDFLSALTCWRDTHVEKDIMPLRALRPTIAFTTSTCSSSGGERHHALAGIATWTWTDRSRPWPF